MILDAYVAVLGALFAGGVVLVVAGLRGTTEPPPTPDSPLATRLRRWWHGVGRTAAERRTRQLLTISAVVVGVLTFILTGVPALALLTALAVPGIPWLWGAGKQEERAIARAEALADWTRRLKDQLSTGAGLVSAIVHTADSAPSLIAEEVRALAVRLQAGADPRRALYQFAADLDDPVAEQVVAALLLHLQDRAEHLGEVLSAIASDTAKQVSMRREVHAKRTQPRITVRFMTVFAVVIIAVLSRGDMLAAYTTPRGQVVLLVLAAGFIGTLAWVRSLTRPPAQPRFLRPPQEVA
ncbi:MAG TPA: type II secretion system F family protein [Natronosporangium sp.]|nr:type II secretion system F family protein [Natronosporangium sp.]